MSEVIFRNLKRVLNINLLIIVVFVLSVCSGDKSAKSSKTFTLDLQVLDRELDAMNTEILDSVEIADRELKSLRYSKYGAPIFSNGWVFYLYDNFDGEQLPYFSIPISRESYYFHLLYRIRLSDFEADSILCNNNFTKFHAVDNSWVFFEEHNHDNYLYKQHILGDERILIKKFESRHASCFGNVIVLDDRVFFTQVVDSIKDIENGKDLIVCVKTDGSDNKILTEPFYRDFCIYKGMIFARNYLCELEKMDLNGNKIDNYGKIGSRFFDVYDDYIFFESDIDGGMCKMNINTKKKQLVNNSFSFENCFIAHNHLFFNSHKSSIQKADQYSIPIVFGDLCCINLQTGKMKTIYSEHDCELSGVYNGILYGKEFIMSDAINNRGSLMKFQINMDGTGKKNLQ